MQKKIVKKQKTTTTMLEKNIQLLQWYYRFLALGKYMENLMHTQDLSKNMTDVKIKTWETSRFGLKTVMIKALLEQIHKQADKKNIFWYLVEISAFRGIMSSMKELLDTQEIFHKFVVSRLQDSYFDFEQIIKLIRNILSHSTNTEIVFKIEDFVKQRDFLNYNKTSLIKIDFLYSKSRKEWKWSEDYWISLEINFDKIKEWQSLFDYVSLHQLYILSELCFNLCEVFKATGWNLIYKR